MNPEAAKILADMFDQIEDDGAPIECIPRLAWFGHEFLGQSSHEEETWVAANGNEHLMFNNIGNWRCNKCSHLWESDDGERCPKCKAFWKDEE